MGGSNSSAHCGEAAKDVGVSALSKPKILTIGDMLDSRIETARKNVEQLCVTKAKLEALNVLDHPLELYNQILF